MSKTILVVDDERDTVELLQTVLSLHGYSVTVAADGLQALDEVARSQPDLILLDVMMPEMDGIEGAASPQERPRHRRDNSRDADR